MSKATNGTVENGRAPHPFRAWRTAAGLTTKQAASLIASDGKFTDSEGFLRQVESDNAKPSIPYLKALERVSNGRANYLAMVEWHHGPGMEPTDTDADSAAAV